MGASTPSGGSRRLSQTWSNVLPRQSVKKLGLSAIDVAASRASGNPSIDNPSKTSCCMA
jgi:hypothetical protein